MADEPDDLVLTYLRRIEAKLDRIAENLRGPAGCVGAAGQQIGTCGQQYASRSIRIDRLDSRIERIERRLDLLPAE